MSPERFKTIRKQRKITQAKLARELRIDVRSVKRYEAGTRAISGPVSVIMEALIDDVPRFQDTILGIIRKSAQAPSKR